MPIGQHHINELKTIYRTHYHKDLPDAEAWAMAQRLLNLYRLLIKCETERPSEVRTP